MKIAEIRRKGRKQTEDKNKLNEIVASIDEEILKTSPFESLESSVRETSPFSSICESSHREDQIDQTEIKTIKRKTLQEIQQDMLLANYIADKSLDNLRMAIMENDKTKLSREI